MVSLLVDEWVGCAVVYLGVLLDVPSVGSSDCLSVGKSAVSTVEQKAEHWAA